MMSSNRLQPPGACATRPAAPEDAIRSTSCRGTATDTSPDELAMLADQVSDFSRSGFLLRVQDAADQARSFVDAHVITTALAVGLLAAALAMLL